MDSNTRKRARRGRDRHRQAGTHATQCDSDTRVRAVFDMLLGGSDFLRVLDAIAKAIERRANESKTKQILNKSRNEQELTKLRAELTDAYNRFMV
jgi:hypothetical protein